MGIGLTLDAGALIALERDGRLVAALMRRALERGEEIAVPAGVLGQVWRDGRRQVILSRALGSGSLSIVALDDVVARAAGQLCGVAGTSDVVDASVIVCARTRGRRVVTSDVQDLLRLDPDLEVIVC